MRAWARQDLVLTASLAEQSARIDPLDGYSAADTAKAYAILAMTENLSDASAGGDLWVAHRWARQARVRDKAYYSHAALAAEIAWLLANLEDYAYSWDRSPPAGVEANSPVRQAIELSQAARRAYWEGDYAQEAEYLRMAVDIDESSPVLFGYLGDALFLAGQADQAAAAWRRAAELAPSGDWVNEALTSMDQAVALNPQDPRLRLQAAVLYIQAGKAADGLNEIKAAEKINAALPADSLMRFDADEQKELHRLRARADALSAATRPVEKL